jgi:hypothetical protein
VGREADDRIWPDGLAHFGSRHVLLPDVNAVGVAGAGQIGIVVDDEEGAVGVTEAAEGERGQLDLTARQRLLAQLDDVDAAPQRCPQQRLGVFPVGPRVAAEVEAGGAQPLAAQRSLGVWLSEAHPSIIARGRRV